MNPVSVEIGGEEFRLKHIDRTKDLPSTRSDVPKIFKLMQRQDWDNAPLLWEGLNEVKHPKGRNEKQWQKHVNQFIRNAAKGGRMDVVVETAKRVERTGFRLHTRALVQQIMWWIQYQGLAANFGPEETKRALSLATQVSNLLEDAKHAGGAVLSVLSDPRTSPEVSGTLLQLSAIRAKQGDEEAAKNVERYAKVFMATLKQEGMMIEGMYASEFMEETNEDNRAVYMASDELQTIAPILYGVRVAQEVLKSGPVAEQLAQTQKQLEKEASERVDIVKNRKIRHQPKLGLWTWEQINSLQ
jgi:hypothetical protein